jgi:hypothetical protein
MRLNVLGILSARLRAETFLDIVTFAYRHLPGTGSEGEAEVRRSPLGACFGIF